jgi:hypothetical protein
MKYSVDQEHTSWRVVDGEAVVIHLDTTYYFGLNETGTFVWRLLAERPYDAEALVAAVASHYEQPPEAVADDVRRILGELKREKLIKEL